jgi:hypothetical protein
MQQIPSQDWPRRLSPLTGTEDLLKQNPAGDSSPQEERIPSSLISAFTISNITLSSVGLGVPVLEGKYGSDFRYRSVLAASSRVSVNLLGSDILIDVAPTQVAGSLILTDISDVTNSPTIGEFLQFNGSGWITSSLVEQFYLSDGTNTQTINGSNLTINFISSPNISVQVLPTNNVTFGWTANLADLTDIPAPTVNDTVLTWNGSAYSWASFATVNTGAVTDGQNAGALGFGVFSGKLGSILRFRNISAASSKATVSLVGNDIKLDVSASNVSSEIKLQDLQDFSGTPSNGDILIYNTTTNEWIPSPSAGAGLALSVIDQTGNTKSFNSTTNLKIYGANGVKTNWNTNTDLRVYLDGVLNNLNDVLVVSPSNNDILSYNTSTAKWENKQFQINVAGNTGGQVLANNDTLRLIGVNGINVQVTNPDTAIFNLTATLTDLSGIPVPSAADQILVWNGTSYVWQARVSGPTLTASNVGNNGFGVFKQKVNNNFEFRNVAANSSKIAVTLDTSNNILVDASPVQIANEINLEALANVTNSPSTNAYLKYDGTTWVTDILDTFYFTAQADSGANITVSNGDSYIIGGGDQFIYTTNLSGTTKKTRVHLDINQVANNINLEDLKNMFGSPSNGDTIMYNGTNFIFTSLSGTSGGSGSTWNLGANAVDNSYAFGTTTNYDVPIYTNNIQRGVFKASGRLGWGTNSPNSSAEVVGSVGFGNVVTKNANYTATDADYMILGDTEVGNVTITLPNPNTCYRREYVIKKINTNNQLIISCAQLIDGASTYTIYSRYNSIKVKSDGTTWQIF